MHKLPRLCERVFLKRSVNDPIRRVRDECLKDVSEFIEGRDGFFEVLPYCEVPLYRKFFCARVLNIQRKFAVMLYSLMKLYS